MISKEHIYPNCSYKSPDEIITNLIDCLGFSSEIKDCVLAREEVRSTGLHNGVAIPHCRNAQIDHSISALATLVEPVLWGGYSVKIIVLLCCPADAPLMIKALASWSRLLNDNQNRSKLLNSSVDDIFEMLKLYPNLVQI